MITRCPACKKRNPGLSPAKSAEQRHEESACSRCGCDLGPVIKISEAAAAALRISRTALCRKQYDSALEKAAHSWNLIHTAAAARIVFLCYLARKDFSNASKWYLYGKKNFTMHPKASWK